MTAAARERPPARPPQPASGAAGLSLSEGFCINLRGRQEACDLCRRACHARAISLSLDAVSIDPARCVGCGLCVPVCPAGAFALDGFDPEAFVAQAAAGPEVTIGCRQSEIRDIAVPCHKMLDARLLAALAAEGVARIRLAGSEACDACPSGNARPRLARAVKTLRSWLGDGAPVVLVARDTGAGPADRDADRASDRAAKRRRLLRGGFAALARAEPEQAAGPDDLPSFDALLNDLDDTPEARARPVPYQQVLARRREQLPFRDDGPVGATGREIDANCSGCMVCSDLCPTGALQGQVGAGQRQISFNAARCTNCTLCQKVCPMAAIASYAIRGVTAATDGRKTLFERRLAICGQCGAPFDPADSAGAGICPQCQNERDMDEDWQEMLSD